MSKLVSQPIYRDAVITGKFLAGVATIAIMLVSIVLVVSGLGIRMLGVIPGAGEILRLLMYLLVSVLYISFWLGISILFSVVFKNTSTSALAALALWIFFSFLVPLSAGFLSDALAPVSRSGGGPDVEAVMKHIQVEKAIYLFSPTSLYGDSTSTILDPMRKTTSPVVLVGPMERISQERFQNPLSVSQSLAIVAPYMISLLALAFLCFRHLLRGLHATGDKIDIAPLVGRTSSPPAITHVDDQKDKEHDTECEKCATPLTERPPLSCLRDFLTLYSNAADKILHRGGSCKIEALANLQPICPSRDAAWPFSTPSATTSRPSPFANAKRRSQSPNCLNRAPAAE